MMSIEEKNRILELRNKEIVVREIAEITNLNKEAVKSFLKRIDKNVKEIRICKECGKEYFVYFKVKSKSFCSDLCRIRWWNKHPENMKNRKESIRKCKCCGKEFIVYGNSKQQFCCKKCARKFQNKFK